MDGRCAAVYHGHFVEASTVSCYSHKRLILQMGAQTCE